MSKEGSKANVESKGLLYTIINAPLTISLSLLSGSFAVIRPYTPRLVPLFVLGLFSPLVIIVSLGVGYYVWSTVSVSWQVPLYLQYGDGMPPYAHAQLPRLIMQQKYSISVELQLPVTESNLVLGNFMTSLTLVSAKNKTLAHVRRPVIVLNPPSSWRSAKPNSIRMNVPLVDSFFASSPDLAATVEIGRKDSWTTVGTGQGREVNIASASLKGLAVPHGIRGLAVRFPMLSSLTAAFIFFLILSLIIAICLLPLVMDRAPGGMVSRAGVAVKKERRRSASLTSLGEGRRRRRSGSSQREGQSIVKAEETEIPSHSATEPLRGLRRRSSRPSMTSELET